jgi:integrase/recombinase XerC
MRYQMNKNKYLLQPEIQSLEYLLKRHWDKDIRNCLIISLALKTGARAQELLNLQKIDISVYDQTVFIRGIKGSNDREIPIPSELFNKLQNWMRIHKENKIFDFSYHRLYQIWDLYRPCPKKFHSLRHTFAIELYKKTKDLRLVQVALGHRNINNTMVYADYIYSKEELKKLIL